MTTLSSLTDYCLNYVEMTLILTKVRLTARKTPVRSPVTDNNKPKSYDFLKVNRAKNFKNDTPNCLVFGFEMNKYRTLLLLKMVCIVTCMS